MSITNAFVIPINENYIPENGKEELIVTLFRNRNKANLEIEAKKSDAVQFYDCGENFDYIKCPLCGTEIDIDWWQEAMDTASESSFSKLNVSTPCCN